MDNKPVSSFPPSSTAQQRETSERSFWRADELAREHAKADDGPDDDLLGQNRRDNPRGLLPPRDDTQPCKAEKPSRIDGWLS